MAGRLLSNSAHVVGKKLCVHYNNTKIDLFITRKRTFLSNHQRCCLSSYANVYFLSQVSNNQQTMKFHDSSNNKSDREYFKEKIKKGPNLQHFIQNTVNGQNNPNVSQNHCQNPPYLNRNSLLGKGRKVYIETYGCQMNVNDTEVVLAILQKADYERTLDINIADIILVMTCAIREGAENKIWNRLRYLKTLKRKKKEMRIGILGCMAERLKHKLIEKEKMVDLVAGPDSYKDLPQMLAITDTQETAINVMLSYDETYADIMPVRLNPESATAFVSIMRGCDNMCSFCIVPFTRGRERSRPIDSIIEEIKMLSDQGIKQVTLLGQNVNSYCDTSQQQHFMPTVSLDETTHLSEGFKTIYKPKKGNLRFADLLDKVSAINPEMRIRFTSPHPKDFPNEVLYLIRDKHNICNQIHLPAQCGSDRILHRMKRGHTREAYLNLVDNIRKIIPNIALSSDFICGFCGETDEEFEETLSLVRLVKYHVLYMFQYSMREKTFAYYTYKDNVPEKVKLERLKHLSELHREESLKLHQQQIGTLQVILIESKSKRSDLDLAGRNDANTKVIIPNQEIPCHVNLDTKRPIAIGDYVVVKITDANSQILKGIPLFHTTLQGFTDHNPISFVSDKDYTLTDKIPVI